MSNCINRIHLKQNNFVDIYIFFQTPPSYSFSPTCPIKPNKNEITPLLPLYHCSQNLKFIRRWLLATNFPLVLLCNISNIQIPWTYNHSHTDREDHTSHTLTVIDKDSLFFLNYRRV